MAYSSKCEMTVFKIQTRDICTALPRRVLVIIYFTTILPLEVCVENLKHVKVKWQWEYHFLGKLKHSSYISFILFLLGRTPDYLKAHVHFISRFRRGLLGSTLLDELPERWHSVKRTLSVCKIETIAQYYYSITLAWTSIFQHSKFSGLDTAFGISTKPLSVFKAASVYP